MNEQALANDMTLMERMENSPRKNRLVFAVLWLLLFTLYLPALHAGWVSDVDELINRIEHGSFWSFINAKLSRGNLYHVSWIAFYVIYRLNMVSPWLCYILLVTLQALNGTLLFDICYKVFTASGVKNALLVTFGGMLLFCVCPHISEVIVWKAAFHYILAMLLTLVVLRSLQRYLSAPFRVYQWLAAFGFLVSSFSHEFFYLTPFFALSLIVYYRSILGCDKTTCGNALLGFFIPLCAIVLFHQLLLTLNTGEIVGTLGSEVSQSAIGYLSKPPLHVFQNVFFGRFFPNDTTTGVYAFFSSWVGVMVFYSVAVFVVAAAYLKVWMKKKSGSAYLLIGAWMAAGMALTSPMWLSDTMLISFDRYSYYFLPFLYMLLVALISLLPARFAVALFTIYAVINCTYTWQVNTYWKYSADIKDKLVHTFPDTGNKKVLVLNLPEYMNGAPVFGPWWHFSFRQAHDLYNARPFADSVYDVASFNMVNPTDGASVEVLSDSVVRVRLTQPGAWWWSNLIGARDYQNNAYSFKLGTDNTYELRLKYPMDSYILVYAVGDKWKTVDPTRQGVKQD